MRISTEYREGIMFVRLKGKLDKTKIEIVYDKVTTIVSRAGIRNLVFNLNELQDIDVKGIHTILYNYELVKNNGGQVLLCLDNDNILNKLKKFHVFNYIGVINNEINALPLMKG